MDFSYVHIRYFIGYVYHICLQDTIQSTLSLCLLCQAMLLPMPLRPLLLTTRSGFSVIASDVGDAVRLEDLRGVKIPYYDANPANLDDFILDWEEFAEEVVGEMQ